MYAEQTITYCKYSDDDFEMVVHRAETINTGEHMEIIAKITICDIFKLNIGLHVNVCENPIVFKHESQFHIRIHFQL